MSDLAQIKKTAIQAAMEAGALLLQHFKNLKKVDIDYKEVDNHKLPVTKWDLAADKIIKKHINKNFPDHDILSEESPFEDNPSNWTWIIDPLDGTKNYIKQKPWWGVSIAVFKGEAPKVGVILAPVLNDLYTCIINQGALKNDEKLKVNNESDITNAQVSIGGRHNKPSQVLTEKVYKILAPHVKESPVSGAAIVDLIRVATGELAGTIMNGIKVWDVAAGVLLVRETGGMVTNLAGQEWKLETKNLIATNSKIHKQIIEIIKNNLKFNKI